MPRRDSNPNKQNQKWKICHTFGIFRFYDCLLVISLYIILA